jgi:imidazolonepropionase
LVATVDLLIEHAAQVVSPGGTGALSGADQGRLEIIPDGAVAVAGGRIVAVGPTVTVQGSVGLSRTTKVVDARGMVVTPGLVDAHTHVVYGGDRIDEFELRARGATYAEILAAGGGIYRTVAATRAATVEELARQTSSRLDRMLASGTTTAESKSGYGLDKDTELKQLDAMGRKALARRHPLELIPTFLGAHAIPPGENADDFVDFLIADVLPEVAVQGIARACDVFCEKGVFNPEQSARLLEAARSHGLMPKLHADELADTGGAALAAKVGALSADHLHCANLTGLGEMARAGVVAVLLPGTGLFLGMHDHAQARAMVEIGLPVALGTDCNPGSCPAHSMTLMMSLAVTQLKLTPAEALVAATANAAASCGAADRIGRLAPGFQADLVLWVASDYRALSYYLGADLARSVIKRGAIVRDSSRDPTPA